MRRGDLLRVKLSGLFMSRLTTVGRLSILYFSWVFFSSRIIASMSSAEAFKVSVFDAGSCCGGS